MLKIGIIGCGHWGPNYIRCFNKLAGCSVAVCCDLKEEGLKRAREVAPAVATTHDYTQILTDTTIQAVVVATPASTHYQIVKACLEHGKDVLAEKPLTLIPEESVGLIKLAKEYDRILMVGHTFIYNPGVIKLKEMLVGGEIGKIYYINATRTHLGLIRNDVNAIWDLAPHDVSIFNFLTDSVPHTVSAIGACHLKKGREDVAFINLLYPDNIIANIHVSWADSNKERSIRVVGSKARAVFNDLDNMERVKLYKKGIAVSEEYNDFGEFQLLLRDGDIISPKVDPKEPLREECVHFVECVTQRKTPLTDGTNGLDVVRVMVAIEKSLKHKGSTEVIQ